MKVYKSIIAALVTTVMLAGLYGCMKQEGPVERAGKKIDKTVEKGEHQIDKTGKKIKEDTTGK